MGGGLPQLPNNSPSASMSRIECMPSPVARERTVGIERERIMVMVLLPLAVGSGIALCIVDCSGLAGQLGPWTLD